MTIGHIVAGYDKATERLAIEHDVPASLFEKVRILAEVPDTDREALGSYPLSLSAVRALASKIRAPLNVDAYDWFLEPVDPRS
ncbi:MULTISPECIES: DUF7683 domain-containing protein [unclassified Methylobacterium]|jgi:hypothetical protein|uniref:DUF7683 domain-containing protein n=1 Tax=unclassified Methylobacterium TaxID=2615210 RepID=UPI001354B974|nr:hypothetical protein [Methylobacterium sp. 2A]MWV24467.1 hypothetical protein [Methylobacterium sp. 2A]